MTYGEAKELKKKLNDECDEASKKLREFERVELGLTPDHIRDTQEWQEADKRFKLAFADLRKFNAWFVKEFRKKRTTGHVRKGK